MSKVDISGFSAEIERILNGTRDEVAKAVKKAVKEVAQEAKDEIDSHITFNDRTGQYRKSLSIKKSAKAKHLPVMCGTQKHHSIALRICLKKVMQKEAVTEE